MTKRLLRGGEVRIPLQLPIGNRKKLIWYWTYVAIIFKNPLVRLEVLIGRKPPAPFVPRYIPPNAFNDIH